MRDGFLLRTSALCTLAIAAATISPLPTAAAKFNKKVDIGSPAPVWKDLIGTDGKKHGLDDYKGARLLVVAFTCNHCPVAQLYEERFIQFAKAHKSREVTFVAISCSLLPPDDLAKMKVRARERRFNFDYLHDPSQETARKYGATVTPQLFVLDPNRKIAYMGKFDDDIEADKVQREYVADAVAALVANKTPETSETFAKGCGIEFGKPE